MEDRNMSSPEQKTAGDAFHFVVDGGQRIRRTVEPEIRERIRGKYSPLFSEAGFLRRIALRWRMEREVRAELRKFAPEGAMYSRCTGTDRKGHSA